MVFTLSSRSSTFSQRFTIAHRPSFSSSSSYAVRQTPPRQCRAMPFSSSSSVWSSCYSSSVSSCEFSGLFLSWLPLDDRSGNFHTLLITHCSIRQTTHCTKYFCVFSQSLDVQYWLFSSFWTYVTTLLNESFSTLKTLISDARTHFPEWISEKKNSHFFVCNVPVDFSSLRIRETHDIIHYTPNKWKPFSSEFHTAFQIHTTFRMLFSLLTSVQACCARDGLRCIAANHGPCYPWKVYLFFFSRYSITNRCNCNSTDLSKSS